MCMGVVPVGISLAAGTAIRCEALARSVKRPRHDRRECSHGIPSNGSLHVGSFTCSFAWAPSHVPSPGLLHMFLHMGSVTGFTVAGEHLRGAANGVPKCLVIIDAAHG